MDWRKGGSSSNVEVDGGGGRRFGGGRGMGLGTIVVLAIIGWVFFKNPLALLDQGGAPPGSAAQSGTPTQVDPAQKDFASAILHSTEQAWGVIFQAKGMTYVDPKLHLFSGGVNTACGGAATAVGRSTARATRRSTSTWRSSSSCRTSCIPPATSRGHT